MKKNTSLLGPALIVLAGIFWGSMGIFVRRLGALGFTSLQITAARLVLGALIFCLILLLRDPKGFRIRVTDIPLFLGLGLASVLFFTVCYFTAITMMPLSTAAILLYTSPIWILLMSVLFFHEKLNGRKVLALALAFGGCVLVSGLIGGSGSGGLTTAGLLFGLGMRNEAKGCVHPAHTKDWDIDEDGLETGVRVFVQFVMDHMDGIPGMKDPRRDGSHG